ncbi:MAG: cobalamin B12-binding domain-containing protein [Desulfobacterales bacterium]|jgi:methylmalonyl-CoA mutase cobalamin-binding subunit|nr:cobalamin B12-binding domain-containing protein [Desulfobacterales bacterium]
MKDTSGKLLSKINLLLSSWQQTGVPARTTLHETADALLTWRKEQRISGLWDNAPRMLGATMDDGWGHGIQLILKYAEVLGVETRFSGLLQSQKQILAACKAFHPNYLGLTVLQFDTEDELTALRKCLPKRIQIIAGGPVFQIDPEFQERVGIDFVARNVSGFIRLLLNTVL